MSPIPVMHEISPALQVHHVSFSYGSAQVLQQVDLCIDRGEFVGLIGPNAGGKSTLLRLILGLLEPQVGSIRVLGAAPRQAVRRIGYVPQFPSFSRDFPIRVEQVVRMGRIGHGQSWFGWSRSREDRIAVQQALDEVAASDLGNRQIGTLSGGQMQRVLLARALVGEPEFLILDEPTASIDQSTEYDIFEMLAHLNQRMTILVVSHDVEFLAGYVRRAVHLNRCLHEVDSGAVHMHGQPPLREESQVAPVPHLVSVRSGD